MKTAAMTPTSAEKQQSRGSILTLKKTDGIRRQKKPVLAKEIRNGMGDYNQSQYSGTDFDDSDGDSTANSRTSSEDNELVGDGNNNETISDDSVNDRNDESGDIVSKVRD